MCDDCILFVTHAVLILFRLATLTALTTKRCNQFATLLLSLATLFRVAGPFLCHVIITPMFHAARLIGCQSALRSIRSSYGDMASPIASQRAQASVGDKTSHF
eukprot:6489885-Amphidinium_carterae.1